MRSAETAALILGHVKVDIANQVLVGKLEPPLGTARQMRRTLTFTPPEHPWILISATDGAVETAHQMRQDPGMCHFDEAATSVPVNHTLHVRFVANRVTAFVCIARHASFEKECGALLAAMEGLRCDVARPGSVPNTTTGTALSPVRPRAHYTILRAWSTAALLVLEEGWASLAIVRRFGRHASLLYLETIVA